MLKKTIPIPKLLQNHIARDLNTKMLTNNQSFVFLGEPEVMINRAPSTYREAFDMYVIRLYVLYHDYGMKFLECYGNEAWRINSACSHILHIWFINQCRGVLVHSDDPMNNERIYNKLKTYFFKDDTSFRYNDWQDFWQNATKGHWEKFVNKIVSDSDSMMEFLEKVASHIPNCQTVCESTSDIFTKNRVYSDARNQTKKVDIYAGSINSRFLRPTCLRLLNTSVWGDTTKAEQELKVFYKLDSNASNTDKQKANQMREELITMTMDSLENNNYTDSELLYLSIRQNIKLLIDDRISEDSANEEDDLLVP